MPPAANHLKGSQEGFSGDDCDDIFGGSFEQDVTWKGSDDVSRLAGKPVRLRFLLQDADLYSMQFQDSSETRTSTSE